MKDPAVLFYTKDFLSGTAFFTDAERGQYIRLLCEQHQNGHIPENHMVSVCLSLASPVVKKFVKDEAGNYFNERMEEEINKRSKFIESRVYNGSKGGRPKQNEKPSGKPLGLATENLIANANGNVNRDEVGKRKRADFDFSFVLPEFKELFERWINYKRERKEMYKTQDSLETCFNNLLKLSGKNLERAKGIVDYSIGNNYQGLFPERDLKTKSNGTNFRQSDFN